MRILLVEDDARIANFVGKGLPNQVAEFEQVPERLVTNFAADGTTVLGGRRCFFDNQIAEPLRMPRSVRYSI